MSGDIPTPPGIEPVHGARPREVRHALFRGVFVLLAMQGVALLAAMASAVLAVVEVADSCRDVFTGQTELRGDGIAQYRVVPGAIEVTCDASTGHMAVPLNGVGACVVFAVAGLLCTALAVLTLRRIARISRTITLQ